MHIDIDIPDKTLAKLLGLARERGITYWCSSVKALRGKTIYDTKTVKLLDQDLYYPIHDGRWILLDAVENKSLVLNHARLVAGILTMVEKSPAALAAVLADATVADLGDLLVQYSLFGELRYAPGEVPGRGATYVCTMCQKPPPCSCLVGSGN